jgi:hypothetical protein
MILPDRRERHVQLAFHGTEWGIVLSWLTKALTAAVPGLIGAAVHLPAVDLRHLRIKHGERSVLRGVIF